MLSFTLLGAGGSEIQIPLSKISFPFDDDGSSMTWMMVLYAMISGRRTEFVKERTSIGDVSSKLPLAINFRHVLLL